MYSVTTEVPFEMSLLMLSKVSIILVASRGDGCSGFFTMNVFGRDLLLEVGGSMSLWLLCGKVPQLSPWIEDVEGVMSGNFDVSERHGSIGMAVPFGGVSSAASFYSCQ